MKDILNHLFEYKTLDKATAKATLTKLAQGEYNNSQMAAFLTAFQLRPVTVAELEGFRDAMLELCVAVDLSGFDIMDVCGTGGDGKNTFNISTLSAFVVAGAGQKVAKHGNKGVSSVCGSSNLLAHFGYEFKNEPDVLKRELEGAGICFLHAPLFHPAMKNVASVRGELGIKTFFNMLGPIVNPAFPKKQLTGVFNLEMVRLYAYQFQNTDKDYVIVHALDGYDEVSLTGGFKMVSNNTDTILHPSDLGLSQVAPEAISGGDDIESSAKIFIDILEGKGTQAQNEVVIANAAMAIYCGHDQMTLSRAVERAQDALMSGKALASFKKLIGS